MPSLTYEPDEHASILLLCENESSANLDKKALRAAGYGHTRVMTSGIEAARLLAGMDKPLDGFAPDIVVCLRRLGDMDGEQFCAIVREHPKLAGFPILLITANDAEAEEMRDLGCGASSLLGRPYSVTDLKKALGRFARLPPGRQALRKNGQPVDTSAFEEALATFGVLLRTERKPEDYFKIGMTALGETRWQPAIAAFAHACREPRIRAEAELGLAAAYKGKGEQAKSREMLARAAESFIGDRRWSRARSVYARLLQNDKSAKNPFLAEAHRLIHQHNYDEAATALLYSLGFISIKNAGERYARVCIIADEPEKMLEALKEKLNADARGQYDFLCEEIGSCMEIMKKQKLERQRQHAAERKWRLARDLGAMPEQQASQADAAQSYSRQDAARANPGKMAENSVPAGKTQVAAFKVDGNAIDASPAGSNVFWACEADGKNAEKEDDATIEAFGRKEMRDEMFTGKSKLNLLFSVMKLTWKLSKGSENSAKK